MAGKNVIKGLVVEIGGDTTKLGKALGCTVLEISALKGESCTEVAEAAVKLARNHTHTERPHLFGGSVEHALAHIEESIEGLVRKNYLRWYAIKLFERDEMVREELQLDPDEIKPESELANDLGINSIELADLVMQCEDQFDVEFNDDDIQKFVTVGDVVNYLESR